MSDPENPYGSPETNPREGKPPAEHVTAPVLPPESGDDQFSPCPRCGLRSARRAQFTWWGGALGPRMLTHVICRQCGNQFNGKTGQPNTVGIAIYTVVSVLIGLAIGIGFIVWTMSK